MAPGGGGRGEQTMCNLTRCNICLHSDGVRCQHLLLPERLAAVAAAGCASVMSTHVSMSMCAISGCSASPKPVRNVSRSANMAKPAAVLPPAALHLLAPRKCSSPLSSPSPPLPPPPPLAAALRFFLPLGLPAAVPALGLVVPMPSVWHKHAFRTCRKPEKMSGLNKEDTCARVHAMQSA